MSSFKNAGQAQRRTHRERSQPAHRAKKFGLLEKHKDYVVRAKDFNKKKNIIKQLRNIADEKNPDEYYRGMINSKTVDGKHKTEKDNSISADALKLLKTQDANYLGVKMQSERKKIEKLQCVLHDTMQEKINSHTVFVDSDEDLEAFDPADYENPVAIVEYSSVQQKQLGKVKKQQYSLLRLRQERLQTLHEASSKLRLQRTIAASKGRVFKSVDEDTGDATYRWRKQRAK